MQNKTRTQEISALGHLVIQNSSGAVNDKSFYLRAFHTDGIWTIAIEQVNHMRLVGPARSHTTTHAIQQCAESSWPEFLPSQGIFRWPHEVKNQMPIIKEYLPNFLHSDLPLHVDNKYCSNTFSDPREVAIQTQHNQIFIMLIDSIWYMN